MEIPIETTYYFRQPTHDPSTGDLTNADATPTWKVFSISDATALISDSLSSDGVGLYKGKVAVTSGNSFAVGIWYNLEVYATVAGSDAAIDYQFRVVASEHYAGVPRADIDDSDVWAVATRTVTSDSGPTASEVATFVWDEPVSDHTIAGSTGQDLSDILTDTGETLEGHVAGLSDLVGWPASDVWNVAARTLTSDSGPTVAETADAVWDEARAGHSDSGTFGLYLDAQITGVGSFAASDVWNVATRTLTSDAGPSETTIAQAVWGSMLSDYTSGDTAGRGLSDLVTWGSDGGLAIDWAKVQNPTATNNLSGTTVVLGNNAIQSSTFKTGAITSDAFAASALSEIADSVWDELMVGHSVSTSAAYYLGLIYADTNELQGNQGNWVTAVASDVWAVATRKLTSDSGPTASEVAAYTWAETTRVLTSDSGPTASEVGAYTWAETTRTLTSDSGPTASEIGAYAWVETARVLTSDSGPTASEVGAYTWAETIRVLTSDSGPTASEVAAYAWAETTRVLTSDSGPTASEVGAYTWAETTRVLTSDSGPTASEVTAYVWNELAASHTTAGTFGLNLGTAVSSRSSHVASDVSVDLLQRSVSDAQSAVATHSLGVAIMAMLESQTSDGTLIIYKTNGTTELVRRTLTSDATASPIVGIG